MLASLLLFLCSTATAQQPSQQDLFAPDPYLVYGDGWPQLLETAESDFADGIRKWIRWTTEISVEYGGNRAPPGSYQDILDRIQKARIQYMGAKNQLDYLANARMDLKDRIEIEQEQSDYWQNSREFFATRIEDTRSALDNARLQLSKDMDATGSGKKALRKLAGWWQEYSVRGWEERFSDGGTAMKAEHESRLALERACRALADSVAGETSSAVLNSLEALLVAANAHYSAQLAYYKHSAGQENPHTAVIQELQGKYAEIDAKYRETFNTFHALDLALGRLQDELDQKMGSALGTEQPDAEPTPLGLLRRAVARYTRLETQLDKMERPISSDSWCKVWVHGGLARLVLQQDRAIDMLRTAAGSWQQSCFATVAPYLDTPYFQVHWAEALFKESTQQNVPLQVAFESGNWKLDGVPLYGVGQSYIYVNPGIHLIEFSSESGDVFDSLLATFEPGESSRITMARDGLDLTSLPRGAAQLPGGGISAVAADFSYLAATDFTQYNVDLDPEPRAPSRLQLHLTASYIQLHQLPHVGMGLGVSGTVFRSEKLDMDLAFYHDMASGENSYSYGMNDSRDWTARLLFMDRAVFRLRPTTLGIRPSLEMGLGVIPPLNAALLAPALGWEWMLDEQVGIIARVTLNTTIWQDTVLVMEPSLNLGASRWF